MTVAATGGGYSLEFRAGAAILLWGAVIVALVLGLGPRGRVPGWALASGAGLLALALLGVVSSGWASDDGAAFEEGVRAAGYLGLFVLVVVAAPAGSARAWLAGVAIGVVVVAGLALGSRIVPSLFPEQELDKLIPSLRTRLSYPVNYWNGLAACMALGAVLLVWLGAHAVTRAGRALAVAAVPVPALALYLTSSRGGVVALAAGLAVAFLAGPARARMLVGGVLGGAAAGLTIALASGRDEFVDGALDAPGAGAQGREVLLGLLLAGAVAGGLRLLADGPLGRLSVPRPVTVATLATVAVGVVVALAASDPAQRLDDFNDPPADPGPARGFVDRHLVSAEGSGRYQFWETGLDAFADQPLRGIGAGGYEAYWAEHGSVAYYIRDAHSLPVELLAELGLAGLVALLVFLGTAAVAGVTALTRARAGPAAGGALALLACGSASAAIDWTWELPAAFGAAVLAAAVLTGPALQPAAEPRRSRFGLGLLTLVVAWAALIGSVIALAAETKLDDSRAAVRRGDLADAADDADAAAAIAPWAGPPRLQTALIRERQGDLRGARRAAAEAAERDSGDWRVWLVITRLAVKDGDVPAARAALRRARTLNPRSDLFRKGAP